MNSEFIWQVIETETGTKLVRTKLLEKSRNVDKSKKKKLSDRQKIYTMLYYYNNRQPKQKYATSYKIPNRKHRYQQLRYQHGDS